jgi:hypothetical protein
VLWCDWGQPSCAASGVSPPPPPQSFPHVPHTKPTK